MQFKMEETTPKADKKTPKKVNAKGTPFKKGGVSITPKTTANTPKSVKKTPKPNSNGTPKEVKDQQKKTPQKNKKPVQEKGNKTPQSEPITPKTPESGSKNKRQKRRQHKSIKKQKLEDGGSKEIITDSAGKQNAKAALKSDKSTPGLPLISISPPRGIAIPSKVVQQIFGESENVIFTQNTSFLIKYKQDVVSKKMKELQNIKINGKPLRFEENKKKFDLLKRIVRLTNSDSQEKVQKFYNAKSIEKIINRRGGATNIYILTFRTEKEAAAASKKTFNLGDKALTLSLYYDHGMKHAGDGKVKSDKQVQKQELDKTKQAKNVQVESKKQEQKQKLNVSKQSKNAQVKRKAEEDEEEEEEEEDDDFDGEIDMGDDDDDEDDDSDDDE